MKKKLLMALSLVMVAVISIAGTMAYLTDTDNDVNVMTLGNVEIEQIEQERVDPTKLADAEGNLTEFTQGKALLPAYYPGSSIPWDANYNVNEAWKAVQANENVIDKFVTVKNTGDYSAYVRTIFAIEVGPEGVNDPLVHIVTNSDNITRNDPDADTWTWEWIEDENGEDALVDINGTTYVLCVATYTGELKAGETTIPSLKQIYLDKTATNEDVALYGETFDILVLSQAVQSDMNGLTNTEALDEAFGDVTAAKAVEWLVGVAPENVADDAAAKDALTEDKENIVVILADDVTYDTAAWAANGMGGDSTKTVTIYGNGHTITFNHTNSDWNNIVTANDATLIINDAHITNSGYNNSAWNRHDINFACPVVLNNVTSDKALAFKDDATLNNVTITENYSSDIYTIWIQANGQTVTIDGLTIDSTAATDGRGIAINDQYVASPSKVTLTVKNATFATEEKAAIMVKSTAGADITLENVDITNVVADTTNVVWIDVDRATAEVTVNGDIYTVVEK